MTSPTSPSARAQSCRAAVPLRDRDNAALEPRRQRLLQGPNLRAVVGHPTGVEDRGEMFEQPLPIAQVGSSDVQRLIECGPPAVCGEVGAASLHAHARCARALTAPRRQ